MENTITENKPGYKKTKLGWIPEDWKIHNLKDCSVYRKGYAFKSKDYSEKGIRIIRVSDTDANSIKDINGVYLNHEKTEQYSEWKLKSDDLIFTTVGSRPPMYDSMVGKVIKVDAKYEGTLLNQNAVRIRSNSFVSQNLLIYFFKQKRYLNYIEKIVRGNANQVSITLEDLFKFKIPIPPLPEQKAIANCLSTWDTAITKLDALIKAKQKLKKALMQQLLSGKKRLPGFEGEWKKTGAGTIFKSISIKNKPNAELLSVTQDRGVIPRSKLEGRVTMPSGKRDGFKLVEIGNFVISLRSFQGGLEYSEYQGLVSPAYTVLTEIKEINQDFYRHYFKSYEFIQRLSKAVIGIRDGKQISYSDFCIVKIPDVSKREQTAIAQVLNTADQEINLLTNQRNQLQLQKKGLMQQLLTGKKRLQIKG